MTWAKMLAALAPMEEAPCVVDLVILVEVVLVAMEIRAASLVEKALHLLFEQVDTVELVQEDQGVALVDLARAAQGSLVVVQETREAQNVWVVFVTLVVSEAPKVQIGLLILQKNLVQAVLEDLEIRIMTETTLQADLMAILEDLQIWIMTGTTVQAVLMALEMIRIVVNGD